MTTIPDHSAGSFGAAEQRVELGDGVQAGGLVHVGVDLLRGRDVGVPEDDLRIAGRDAQVLEQGCGGVPQGMETDLADAVAVADAGEGPDEVARLDRTAGAGGEAASRYRSGCPDALIVVKPAGLNDDPHPPGRDRRRSACIAWNCRTRKRSGPKMRKDLTNATRGLVDGTPAIAALRGGDGARSAC